MEKLDIALEEHVSEHYEDLINQATGMDVLEEVKYTYTLMHFNTVPPTEYSFLGLVRKSCLFQNFELF